MAWIEEVGPVVGEIFGEELEQRTCNVKIVNSTAVPLTMAGQIEAVDGKGHATGSEPAATLRPGEAAQFRYESTAVLGKSVEGAHGRVSYSDANGHTLTFEWSNPVDPTTKNWASFASTDVSFRCDPKYSPSGNQDVPFSFEVTGGPPAVPGGGAPAGGQQNQPGQPVVVSGPGGQTTIINISPNMSQTGNTTTATGGLGTGGAGGLGTGGAGGNATGGDGGSATGGAGGAGGTGGHASSASHSSAHAGHSGVYLMHGSTGMDVVRWQEQLNVVVQMCLTVDGVFGPATDMATRHFQQAYGLTVDGMVGAATMSMMERVMVGAGACQDHTPVGQPAAGQPAAGQPAAGQSPAGAAAVPYHPDTHGAFDPRVHGEFHPDVHGAYDPMIHGAFNPYVHGAFNPYVHGAFNPYVHGAFHPEVHGAYDPYVHGEYHPEVHGAYDPYLHGGPDTATPSGDHQAQGEEYGTEPSGY